MAFNQLLLDFEVGVSERPLSLLSVAEIYRDATQDLLARLGEDCRLERKPSGIHRDPLAEYFSMWANTAPEGGLIVVGIADKGGFPGCSRLNQIQLNDLEKVGRELCPDARYDTRRIEIVRPDGQIDFLVLFRVDYREDKVVETNRGEAFKRLGDSKYKLTEEEKRELAIDKGQVSLELEACGLSYPEDFAMDAIRGFAASVKQRKGLKTEYTPEQILANRHLGQLRDGLFVPNIACALLFAKDPQAIVPGCSIRFQRYEGTEKLTGDKRNVVRDEFIEGRVPEIIVKADEVIGSQIRTFSRLVKDGRFFTAPEYPQPAWYEAIVNACVHRSYHLRNMNIFVRMFDDRLEIESPGGFPPFVRPENIYEVHHRRNYFLMDAMFYMDFVKCENEGTRRMRDVMLEMRLPEPKFEQKQVGNVVVRVTLRNNTEQRRAWIDQDTSDVIGEAIFATLDPHEKRCINFIAEHGKINVSDAMRLTQLAWHAARRMLNGLVEDKKILEYVSKFARDPNAHYRLAEKPGPPKAPPHAGK